MTKICVGFVVVSTLHDGSRIISRSALPQSPLIERHSSLKPHLKPTEYAQPSASRPSPVFERPIQHEISTAIDLINLNKSSEILQ